MPRFTSLRRLLVPLCFCLATAGCAFQNAMSRGDDALKVGNYDAAVAEYTHAVQLDPDSPEARAGLEAAKRGAVTTRIGTSRAALRQGDLLAAARGAGEAQRLLPDDSEVARLVSEVEQAVLGAGDQDTKTGKFLAGRMLYADVRDLVPSIDVSLAEADRRLVDAWTTHLTKQRDAAQKAGRNGDALLHERQLIELQPTAVARAHCGQLVQTLRDRNEVIVGVAPLDADDVHATDDHGPGDGDGGHMGPGAGRHPPGKPGGQGAGPRRFNKQFLPLARGMAQIGTTQWLRVLSPDEPIKNERAVIRFGFGTPRFDTDQRTDQRSAQYQTGTRQVPSPFYADRQRNVQDEERRLMSAEEEVTRQQRYVEQYTADVQREGDTPGVSTGAEQNLWNAQSALEAARRNLGDGRTRLQNARDELARTPPFQTEAVYATWTYDVITYTVRALSRLVARIEWQGQPLAPSAFPLSAEATDTTHAAQAPLRLAADPITLPAKRDMVAGLMTAASAHLQGQVQATFKRAVETERAFAMSLDGDARVEELVVYLLMDQGIVDPEVDALLFELRGVPGASALLDSCGGAAQ